MEPEVFEAAMKRLQRAWKEAQIRYKKRESFIKPLLVSAARRHRGAARKLAEVFASLKDNPCVDCGRCCTQAAFQSGFHTHSEREMLLEKGVNIGEYIVPPESKEEHPFRCLFLGPKGCNIPASYRSAHCINYVCLDRLGPKLAQQGLEAAYHGGQALLEEAKKPLNMLPPLTFPRQTDNFGDG